ncbi:hypothetical protein PsYK624_015070 [Phanerochaete sordida]|uniref:Uncharacterized protein n=1 Tax=Phanerochaete sordida TaxID=48140 RepID=A0A9P3FY96_9APHY|nr:hypothetical protein PsYK624_015070 [Phanerochaete sordida]
MIDRSMRGVEREVSMEVVSKRRVGKYLPNVPLRTRGPSSDAHVVGGCPPISSTSDYVYTLLTHTTHMSARSASSRKLGVQR